MGGSSLPPGFRFHPTDEELIAYYLKRKVEGLEIELEVIPVIDLYKFDPWELPEKSFLPKRDMEWFFFCPRDRKYPNGTRTNRATKAGYWKATGKDRNVASQSSVIGYRKTLVFYCGRAPSGERTDWVMHEYRLCDDYIQGSSSFQVGYALCRVTKRNIENTQKMSDFNDKSKSKRVGSSSRDGDFNSTMISNAQSMVVESDIARVPQENTTSMPHFESPILANNSSNVWVSPNLILDSSKEFQQGQQSTLENYRPYDFQSAITSYQPPDYIDDFNNTSTSFSNFTEEIEPTNELNRIFNMSPYSENLDYMGFWGDEDMTYRGYEYDHNNSLINPNCY